MISGNLKFLDRRPGKIICVGLNYPLHLSDGLLELEYPVLFQKPVSGLVGNGQSIIIPRVSNQVLYEGELAIVIGRTAKNLTKEESIEYIAGFTIANDISAADIEARSSQWASGKMFDTFTPIGPIMVHPSKFKLPLKLQIETRLNGNLVQTGNTSEMIFKVRFLLAYISTLTTLVAGDVVMTGSPKQCNGQSDPRIPLKHGDHITVTIEGIGTLENPVVGEENLNE